MFTKSSSTAQAETETSGLAKVISAITEFTGQRSEVSKIVEAIEADHADLKKFIKILKNEQTPASIKRKVYGQFVSLLRSHSSSEEKAMYAISLSLPGLKLKTLEGLVEHNVASTLSRKISPEPSHKELPTWLAQVQVLAELVEHHVKEEESDLLPEVKKQLSEKRQIAAGQKFVILRRKSQKGITPQNAGVLA